MMGRLAVDEHTGWPATTSARHEGSLR